MSEKFPIVKSKDNTLYLYKGEVDGKFEFENIVTGKSGLITKEIADSAYNFTIPFSINMVANDFPQVLYLIKELKMKVHESI